jgi:hypothetical protein
MLQPRDVHLDALLSNLSIMYRNDNYIADRVFRRVRVEKDSDKYPIFDKGPWFKNRAAKRAPGAMSQGGDFTLSHDSYLVEEEAFHTLLVEETMTTADAELQLERAKTEFVTDKILLAREVAVAARCLTAANWANSATLSGTDRWSDYDNSDPSKDVDTARREIHGKTGKNPNTIAMGREVWDVLKHHPLLLDRMAVTGLRIATRQVAQEVFEIPNLLVGEAIVNTAPDGATDAFSYVWGKHVWIGYTNPEPLPTQFQPSAGYTFVWPVNGMLRGVRRFKGQHPTVEILEAFEKVTGSDLGYLIRNAVA